MAVQGHRYQDTVAVKSRCGRPGSQLGVPRGCGDEIMQQTKTHYLRVLLGCVVLSLARVKTVVVAADEEL